MLTKQEIFLKVQAHLLKQNAKAGKRAINGDFACMYSAPNGMSCAVGCLLKPKTYSPDMEGMGIHDTIVQDALLASDVPIKDPEVYNLLDELQMCHDGVDVIRWQDKLEDISRLFGVAPNE